MISRMWKSMDRENTFLAIYAFSTIMFSVICIIPATLEVDVGGRSLDYKLAMSGVHTFWYQDSLVAGIFVAMPMLFDFTTDSLSLKSQGAIFNLLILLSLLISNVIALFYVIPHSDFKLVVCMYVMQLICVQGIICAYLTCYGKTIWCKVHVLIGALCLNSGMALSTFQVINISYITDNSIDYIATTLEVVGVIVLVVTSIRWVFHVRRNGSAALSLDEYCCNLYVTALNLLFIGICGLFGIFSFFDWNDESGALLASQNFLLIVFLIFLTVSHSRTSRRELAVRKAAEELELKKVLVRFIGHEIRTPLNTVFMGLQHMENTLAVGSYTSEELNEIVEDLKASCDDSINILNQLLLYDKIDSGLAKLDKTTFAVIPFIESAMKPFTRQARDDDVDFRLVAQPAVLSRLQRGTLTADRSKLAVVMRNLLSNALKFTRKAPVRTIQIVVEIETDTVQLADGDESARELVVIRVKDSGAGMSPENITRLFYEVVQFSPEKLQAGGGSGLGLWISHQIITLHNGSLTASSDGEGQGSAFTVQLEINFSDNDAAATANAASNGPPRPVSPRINSVPRLPAAPTSTRMSPRLDLSSAQVHPEPRPRPRLAPHAPPSLRLVDLSEPRRVEDIVPGPVSGSGPLLVPCSSVLLVDDARMNRKMAVKLIGKRVGVLEEAEDGVEAVEKVRRSNQAGQPFDLILMDFVMPNMDGPTATRAIRDLGFQGVIIGVTGNALPEDIAHFMAHGASEVLPKPLNMDVLEQVLAGLNRRLGIAEEV